MSTQDDAQEITFSIGEGIPLENGQNSDHIEMSYTPLFRTVKQHMRFLLSGLTLEQWIKVHSTHGSDWRG